jgi:hypothetical protein
VTDPTPAPVAAAGRVESFLPRVDREAFEYRVRLRGIGVGRVQVAVGDPGWVDGRRAIIVKTRGHSDGLLSFISDLTWELTTTLDLATGRPIEHVETSRVVFRGEEEHDSTERTWSEGDTHHDLHSAVATVRGWRSRPGDRLEMEVRIAGAWIGVGFVHAGSEFLPSARIPAVRYEGTALDKYGVVFWVSDDEQRVPLRVATESKWGSIDVELVDYRPPS